MTTAAAQPTSAILTGSCNGCTVKVESWDGNYRPYRAKVYRADGSYVGTTGACSTPSRALAAGARLASEVKALDAALGFAAEVTP